MSATWLRIGLPAKLLLLTAVFVMLAEILIFLPSIANYRISWLNDRLTAANVAALPPRPYRGATSRQRAATSSYARPLCAPSPSGEAEPAAWYCLPVSELNIDEHFDLRQPPGMTVGQDLCGPRGANPRCHRSVLRARGSRHPCRGLSGPALRRRHRDRAAGGAAAREPWSATASTSSTCRS